MGIGAEFEQFIEENFPGWETDGYGFDSCLICPCGHMIELDGRCPDGCESPLIDMGMI